ncbi:VWA domain-containing protein [Candidatus Poribacteria bacterium]|nr:VWA domain-containing protein [Candidatus Poribacteria bacterium]MYK94974.1 VWA domain-containing protein [Candidatus Poribacteria bacterium]
MFEKIMRYPIDVFREGNFSFGVPLPGLLIAVLLVALIVATIWAYRSTQGRIRHGFRGFLIFLRTVALCLLAFCLLKPFLTIYQSNPDDSYLLVMVDRSKSMQITDSIDSAPRLRRVNDLLFAENEGLLEKLNTKFKVRLFAFDTTAKRIPDTALTSAEGESTDIPGALNEALDDLQGIPLSGAVLLTDGVDKSGSDIAKFAMQIRERKLPIHTVGVGSEAGNPDLEIVKLDVPRTAEEDFPVEIWATVKRKGFTGKKVSLQLTSNGRILKTEPVDMDEGSSWIPQIGATDTTSDVKTKRVLLKFTPRQAGTQKFEVHAALEETEPVPQNNTKTFLLKVAPTKRVKILFVDGKPRAEFGFIKRTLKKDPNIQLTDRILTNLSEGNRRYLGTRTATSHDFDFYPDDKETLFDFDAIILGNVDASQFTAAQLENTLEFVRTRGGGLLMLGGSSSLGNHELAGSYINTAIAQCLPVEIELGSPPTSTTPRRRTRLTTGSRSPAESKGYKLQLTSEGKGENLMALADTPIENMKRWTDLKPLVGYSKVKRAKAGALVLAEHPTDRNEFGNRILIATHNYNAGRVMVFTPHTSWRWQMLKDSAEDDSHERFWRQTARWLTTAPKEHIKLDIAKTAYTLKESVVIEVTATDQQFQLTNNAKIRAIVVDEAGKRKELKLEQVLGEDGLYTARFIPNQYGEYTVTATGTLAGESLGEQQTLFEVKASYAEFSNAELNVPLLKTLAEVSGGKYYAMEEAAQLVNQIPLVESATSKITDVDIWDIPLIFGAVIALLGFEWFLRKRGGLV